MTLDEVLKAFRERPPESVLVTGPQRSGTTIAAHILASELRYAYVDETEFGAHDHRRASKIAARGHVVLQGPGLCHVAHVYALNGTAVVMMRRDVDAIRLSEERIGWRTEREGFNLRIEQHKYRSMFGVTGDDIAAIKYYCWDMLQKRHVDAFDLDYESMRQHPLWRSRRERDWFGPRQWQSRAHPAPSPANAYSEAPILFRDTEGGRG